MNFVRLFFYFSFFIFHFIISSCDKRDVRTYYFPLNQLQGKPKMYMYKCTSRDTSFNLYWAYETQIQGDSVFLTGQCFSPSFEKLLVSVESRQYNGMLLKDLEYYGADSTGKSVAKKVNIRAGAAFPFEITDSTGVFVSNYQITDPKDTGHITTVTRNRRFLRDTTVQFEGKKMPAIIFGLKEEQVEHDNKRGGWQHIFNIEEVYAQNIGLFSTKRFISDSETFLMQLEKIITLEEFERIKN